MDYSKIRLANERNQHVTKRLNRLSTWKFFKVIYRENIWRMFGYNFLMLLLMAPMLIVGLLGNFRVSSIQTALPLFNGLGFSTGYWTGAGEVGSVTEFLAQQTRLTNTIYGAWIVLASLLLTFMFSGGFAVIRDTFWTGKLSTVGVFKSMWKGVKANFLYALVSNIIISGMVFGIYELFVYLHQVANLLWLAIVLAVVLGIVALFVTMYLLIVCSVSVTYKQSLYANLDDAWRLLWLNIWPNLIHLILALLPFALYIALGGTLFQQILMIVMFMFGGLYFPLVWQTHLMKTFALFHPIEPKKKKQVREEAEAAAQQTEQNGEQDTEQGTEQGTNQPQQSQQPQQQGSRKKKRPKVAPKQNEPKQPAQESAPEQSLPSEPETEPTEQTVVPSAEPTDSDK